MTAAENRVKAKSDAKLDATEEKSEKLCRANWLAVGCGFGSLLYLTQAVFGEVSVILRWVVSGYPDPGPMPYPWG